MTTQAKPHGFVTKGIHWLSAGLIGVGYLKGLDSVAQLADPTLFMTEVVFALTLGGVFLLRLLWTRTIAGVTRLPEEAPKWEHWASRAVHMGLYASVFGIILSGLGIALAYSVPWLGGLFMGAMLGLHEAMLAALPLLLIAHVAGAIWHKIVRRDGVLESMTGPLPV
ncbi:cytochrome b [Pacificoceanicola onchidii]|uniref:cytochrome b n=1 Tax=Pacificoceanicola onchidii TaxID=2562685 RepID=UPI0010A439A9|nr:cytochrome b/b6 domain-containing protein [Pacificoceanicola onchidii]